MVFPRNTASASINIRTNADTRLSYFVSPGGSVQVAAPKGPLEIAIQASGVTKSTYVL